MSWARTYCYLLFMGPQSHAPWLGSCVFDGARAFEGVAPDLDKHCRRLVRSVESFGLKHLVSAGQLEELARDGIGKFRKERDSTSGRWRGPKLAMSMWIPNPPGGAFRSDFPLPAPASFSITCSPYRRPSFEFAPTDAKAACHYPNSARAMREARSRGFDNAAMLDAVEVSELATANLMLVKNGEVHTPVPNGTFLVGITRGQVIDLLLAASGGNRARAVHHLAGIHRCR